ncbi:MULTISPECIES: nucleotidyltransferase domain-containing protein [Actinomadura]|uniref:Nucleotidyltransferase domain-containing protein n=1 Tax=Actinomadura yumaensis TaxID=111807 RepID=A0ABW2CIR3_9ACTN|nr:amino acid transporter [Actinomadura sp. J1-007]MWK34775.1 amino acid transporter [Actinomadura sp. J1-007]
MGATRIGAPYGPWEPADPDEAASLLSALPAPWWIAGGYAIELALGRAVRSHADLDVMVLRRDQRHVQEALAGWEWWAADPPGTLRPWARGERLPARVHDVWCRPGPAAPWRVQIMLDEASGGTWVSRRDPRVRRPVAAIGATTADGVPYLSPEIQLFYKAAGTRPKDETDFDAALPALTVPQRRWLDGALALVSRDHPWRRRLAHGQDTRG